MPATVPVSAVQPDRDPSVLQPGAGRAEKRPQAGEELPSQRLDLIPRSIRIDSGGVDPQVRQVAPLRPRR